MDVSETQSILAAAREYCMLSTLESGIKVTHESIRSELSVGFREYNWLWAQLSKQGCVASDGERCWITESGIDLVHGVRIRTSVMPPGLFEHPRCCLGTVLSGNPPDIGDLNRFVRSVGGIDAAMYSIDGGRLVRESMDSRVVLGFGAAEEMRFVSGLTEGKNLAAVSADTYGKANVAAVTLGILDARFRRFGSASGVDQCQHLQYFS